MSKEQQNLDSKMRQVGLINMSTKEYHSGLQFMSTAYGLIRDSFQKWISRRILPVAPIVTEQKISIVWSSILHYM